MRIAAHRWRCRWPCLAVRAAGRRTERAVDVGRRLLLDDADADGRWDIPITVLLWFRPAVSLLAVASSCVDVVRGRFDDEEEALDLVTGGRNDLLLLLVLLLLLHVLVVGDSGSTFAYIFG